MALAQLARASPLQGEGRGFESLNAHQQDQGLPGPDSASRISWATQRAPGSRPDDMQESQPREFICQIKRHSLRVKGSGQRAAQRINAPIFLGVFTESLIGCLEAIKLRATYKSDKARMVLVQLRSHSLDGRRIRWVITELMKLSISVD